MIQKVKPNLHLQQAITGQALKALKDDNYESDCGQCKRFIRQVLDAIPDSRIISPPAVIDAAETLEWYEKHYPECIVDAPGVPGDLLFKRGTRKSPHGHVAFRVYGNKTAENATTKAGAENGDCRTQRTLAKFGKIDAVVRPYKD